MSTVVSSKVSTTKTLESPKKPGANNSKSAPKTLTKTKSRAKITRKKSKSSKSTKKKGGLFGCCTKKRKVTRSKKRSVVRKKPVASKLPPSPKTKKSPNKSIKGGVPAKPGAVALKSGPQVPVKKSLSPKSGSVPRSQETSAPSSIPTTPKPLLKSTTSNTDMVTAPSSLPAPEPKSFSAEPVAPSSPKRKSSEVALKSIESEDDVAAGRKNTMYPCQKFFMTQFVRDDCRVRRWVYEDATPLTMESNMSHVLKEASSRIAFCRDEKERRGAMIKDLNELTEVLNR